MESFFYILIGILVVFVLIGFGKLIELSSESERLKTQSISNANERFMQTIGMEADTKFNYEDLNNKVEVFVDNHNNKLMVLDGKSGRKAALNFKDIIGMEFKEDGISTNGVGRAAVGGILFGGVGAVVGAVTGKRTVQNIKIIIYVSDVVSPFVEISINQSSKIKCDSSTYKEIMEFERRLDATIRAILAKNESLDEKGDEKNNNIDRNDSDIVKKSKINDKKPIDYFLMFRVGSSNAGRKNYEGKWCLNGFGINYASIEGKTVDLYSEDMELVASAHVELVKDFSSMNKNRVSLLLDDYQGENYPEIAYAVEEGKQIDGDIIQYAENLNYNSASM